jgi:hypothetical protein
MSDGSITRRIGKWLTVAAMLGYGLAMAQTEPTLKQVYDEAQAGRLDQAQVMMQQVLVAHPGSAKAHFVSAELAARQGKMSHAREALAMAEKLAPGLPFAKPESVQALRTQLATKSSPAAPASPFPWGLALALGGGAIGLGIYLMRKKPAPAPLPQAMYPNPGAMQSGLSGPQGFGMGNNVGNTMGCLLYTSPSPRD